MERWGVRERVCAVELFIWTGSVTEIRRGFHRERIQRNLTASDFFLWGYLESKVYSTRPTDLHALKEYVWEEIAKFSEETLQAVMCSFLTRVHLCIEEGGGHLKNIVHKN